MLFINFKTYPQATDRKAVELGLACQKAQKNIKIPLVLLVQAADIAQVKKAVILPLWAQHIDPVEPGQATGFTTALAVRKDGAQGVMLNHSEHPLPFADLKKAVNLAKKQDLRTLICVKSIKQAKKAKGLEPDFIAFENPQLIGTGVSMANSQKGQKQLAEFIKLGIDFPIVGAGISKRKDVKKSLELGTRGILVSSAVVKAKDPQKTIEKLAAGFE